MLLLMSYHYFPKNKNNRVCETSGSAGLTAAGRLSLPHARP